VRAERDEHAVGQRADEGGARAANSCCDCAPATMGTSSMDETRRRITKAS
jgi:hypothetical protein